MKEAETAELAKVEPQEQALVTRESLPAITERAFLENAEDITRKFISALKDGLDRRDKNALQMAGQMLGFIKQQPGFQVNVNQQNNTQINGAGNGGPARSFEDIVRTVQAGREQSVEAVEAEIVDQPE